MDRERATEAWEIARASVRAARQVYEQLHSRSRDELVANPVMSTAIQPAAERAAALDREPGDLPADEGQAWALLRRVHEYAVSLENAAQAVGNHGSDQLMDDLGDAGWTRAVAAARSADAIIMSMLPGSPNALPGGPVSVPSSRRRRRGFGGGALIVGCILGVALLSD